LHQVEGFDGKNFFLPTLVGAGFQTAILRFVDLAAFLIKVFEKTPINFSGLGSRQTTKQRWQEITSIAENLF